MWYGLQVVLSCATTWITYVATGPLQNAKHDLRFPLILCLIFYGVALALEGVRFWMTGMRTLHTDVESSQDIDAAEVQEKDARETIRPLDEKKGLELS